MKIAFVTDGLFPDHIGGIQKYSFELVRHLAEAGATVHLYLQHDSPRSRAELSGIPNIFFVPVQPLSNSIFPGKYLRNIKKFSIEVVADIYNSNEFDVAYFQGFTGYALSLPQYAENRSPLAFVNLHGLEMYQPARGTKAKLVRLYFRRFVSKMLAKTRYAIALGEDLKKIMLRVQPGLNISVIPNGINENWLNHFDRIKPSETLRKYLFVGRFEWRKGLDTLNQVLNGTTLQKNPNWEMHFVGDIPEDKRVKSNNIFYHGICKDEKAMMEHYGNADVLVCPSYSEGMPTVVLEAMAAGLAVIATRVGATGELVSPANGFLIPPFDVDSLQNAMSATITMDAQLLDGMKENSKKLARDGYMWKEVAKKHILVFEKYLQN